MELATKIMFGLVFFFIVLGYFLISYQISKKPSSAIKGDKSGSALTHDGHNTLTTPGNLQIGNSILSKDLKTKGNIHSDGELKIKGNISSGGKIFTKGIENNGGFNSIGHIKGETLLIEKHIDSLSLKVKNLITELLQAKKIIADEINTIQINIGNTSLCENDVQVLKGMIR